MKKPVAQLHIATAALLLAVLSIGPPLLAQAPVRIRIPGAAFSPQRGSPPVAVTDVAGGRRFRGGAFAKVMLTSVLQLPPASAARPAMERLVVHFRTSPSGPSLRSVALLEGSGTRFNIPTQLSGDYTTRETTTPKEIANVWDWRRDPLGVHAQGVLRLEVQFPGGFDSQVDPGEFVLTSVVIDFPHAR